jgi:hypothetical protein
MIITSNRDTAEWLATTFIAADKACAPTSVLCKVLEVSRTGYYASEER